MAFARTRQNLILLSHPHPGPAGTPIMETTANPLEVARRVAFLLDQGVRAKAGTLSDTGTDDG